MKTMALVCSQNVSALMRLPASMLLRVACESFLPVSSHASRAAVRRGSPPSIASTLPPRIPSFSTPSRFSWESSTMCGVTLVRTGSTKADLGRVSSGEAASTSIATAPPTPSPLSPPTSIPLEPPPEGLAGCTSGPPLGPPPSSWSAAPGSAAVMAPSGAHDVPASIHSRSRSVTISPNVFFSWAGSMDTLAPVAAAAVYCPATHWLYRMLTSFTKASFLLVRSPVAAVPSRRASACAAQSATSFLQSI